MPECGVFGLAVFGESRDRLAEMFDEAPLGKLIGLFAMGDVWERHGLTHPLGNDSKGYIDVVIHGLDPDDLRDIAPTIPFEMVEETLWVGNTEELVAQFEPFARAGAEHVVLANATGVVGGMEEIMARGAELPALRAALGEL
jgi:phthiodiolone/phenolphthiodiolone dimycocerosates ketoreductase